MDELAMLKADVALLRQQMAAMTAAFQYIGGQNRVYDAATLSLILAHAAPDQLAPPLRHHLSKVDAMVVAESNSEDHVSGVQAGQNVILSALDDVLQRHRS